ncbi:MAG: hypothetical protein FWF63_09285 [Fibromonadales bacterium]|nr:hypothetical protein [Fibromonadales bacterium]
MNKIIVPKISEVYIIDVSKILPHCETKYCICITTGINKYFLINSENREMYDTFEINASDYKFLKHNSYVGCSKAHTLESNLIIKKIGNLNFNDMSKILEKIRKSKYIAKPERESMTLELEEWLNNYKKM